MFGWRGLPDPVRYYNDHTSIFHGTAERIINDHIEWYRNTPGAVSAVHGNWYYSDPQKEINQGGCNLMKKYKYLSYVL